jgi:hypothetical protein
VFLKEISVALIMNVGADMFVLTAFDRQDSWPVKKEVALSFYAPFDQWKKW